MLKRIITLAERTRTRLAVMASSVFLCCGITDSVQALPFNQIHQVYFFGDSLSDSGFNNLLPFTPNFPAGKAPTYTTYGGYTWSQYVARDVKGFLLPVGYPVPNPPDTITNNTTPLSLPVVAPVSPVLDGVCYAAGGSTTNSTGVGTPYAPSLAAQVSNFLNQVVIEPNDVIFVWSGANDLLKLLLSPTPPTQFQLLMAANYAATNIANQVALLSDRGARRIVIMSLPNIGYTPLILGAAASNPSLPASIKSVTFSFNSMLNQSIGKVIASHPYTKVLYVDVYDLLDNVILAAQQGKPYVVAGKTFNFVNYNTPACGNVISALFCPPGTPAGYIFADTLHPTDEAHRLLSLYVESQIYNWA
ncbi:SGNH/GDSL hydrolase family protein [Legionella fallonii]|uniref:Uncharacterized protein n=1 Tax=Legionella fallonii LLAP-10 TaxID=1212491 RepID=A0A098G3V2_9GAMM|nr:SGNH/GDSL hydrolase family protein [Legionella fallonii]CEG56165.1 conserved exported protein of unknown function [Legionella fallonii LLAP-10]